MATEAPTKPTETINVKGMSDRWKAAQAAGGIPPTPPSAPEAPKPEPPKAPETPTPVESKAGIPEAPKPKPTEPSKAPEPTKPPEKIPSTNFKELEASRDEFRKKAEAAEAKAKEIEAKLATAVDPAKITELEAKLEKANKQAEEAQTFVDRFYLEHSPSFRKAYSEKIESIVEDTKEAIGGEAGEKIANMLKLAPTKGMDEELEKATEELSQFKQGMVIKAYTELKRLHRERDGELKNSKENVKKLQEYEQQQAQTRNAEFAKSIKSTFSTELSSFESGVDGFKAVEGNVDYNKIVSDNRSRAEEFLASDMQNPVNRARIALWAAYGYHAKQLNSAQQERIAKLEKQLADIQGANPGLRGTTAKPDAAPDAKSGNKPGDKAVSRWQEAMSKGIPSKE